jgi:cytoskeletal protein CcmA (bactofilin family)
MSIFKKSEPPSKPRNAASPQRVANSDGAISIIGPGMRVVGDITTEGTVRIEGEVEGTIRAGKAVVLGQGGVVEGDIYTVDAVIGGTVSGSVVATNRLELQSSCTVTGRLRTLPEHLKLEEGARFTGEVDMSNEGEPLGGIPDAEERPQEALEFRGSRAELAYETGTGGT